MSLNTIAKLAPRLEQIARVKATAIHLEGEPSEVVTQALDAVVAANRPETVFVRGGQLHRLVRDENDRARLEAISLAALRVAVERSARLLRGSGENARSLPAPRNLLESLGALGQWPGLPPVVALVEAPVLRSDGTVLDSPGYDPSTRLIYDPDPRLQLPLIPRRPTREDVATAVRQLRDEVLVDFPFAAPADEANALALLLTPIIRHLVPLVPLALIDAPRAGSGKGLLGAVAAIIATGHPPSVFPAPHDEAEWGKALTALLERGTTFIFIDEVSTLRSARLAATLTASEYQDRRLGRTEIIAVPQRATWIAAGNNVQLAGDIPRRAYPIRLDPKLARPWTRTGFHHANLEDWISEHRGELLAALLTLARAWHAAGRPTAAVPVLGSFSAWAQTVAGILAHAGVEGFLSNLTELYNANDEDSNAWEVFLRTILGVVGDRQFTTGEVAQAIDEHTGLEDALPPDLAAKRGRPSFKQALGKALRRHVDTRHGDDGIHATQARTDARNRSPVWQIAVDSAARECGSDGSKSAHTADEARARAKPGTDPNHSRNSRNPATGDAT